jgi:hypothetical protein
MSNMRGGGRTLPYAFTEQGVAMQSGVLRSQRVVEVNIAIMRTFVQLRRLMDCHLLVRRKKFNMRQTALLESALPQRNIWGCQRPVFGVGNQDVADKGGRQIRVVQGRFTDQRPELNLSGNGATLCVCMRFGLGVQLAINAYGDLHETVQKRRWYPEASFKLHRFCRGLITFVFQMEPACLQTDLRKL